MVKVFSLLDKVSAEAADAVVIESIKESGTGNQSTSPDDNSPWMQFRCERRKKQSFALNV